MRVHRAARKVGVRYPEGAPGRKSQGLGIALSPPNVFRKQGTDQRAVAFSKKKKKKNVKKIAVKYTQYKICCFDHFLRVVQWH